MANIWQIASIVANFAVFFEVLYLFTCGQRYMQMNSTRQFRDFKTDRLLYVAFATLAPINGLLNATPSRSLILTMIALAVLFGRKCYSATLLYRKHRIRAVAKTPAP